MPAPKLEVLARIYPIEDGEKPRLIEEKGQVARTLLHAAKSGEKGFTSLEISTWALRLSHYVFCLRNSGLTIDMEREDHDGPAGDGWHGRYYLRNRVEIIAIRNAGKAGGKVAA